MNFYHLSYALKRLRGVQMHTLIPTVATFAVLASPQPVVAETCMELLLKSGRSIIIPISDFSCINFSGDDVSIGSEKLTFSDLDSYRFIDKDVSDIEDITTDDNAFYLDPSGELIINGTTDNGPIRIFDIDGKVCAAAAHTYPDGRVGLNFKGLQPGIYIIKTGDQTIKFRKL